MKKSKKAESKISKLAGFTETKMNKVLGGAINYNAAKSNTGNLADGTTTTSDPSAHA